MKGEEIVWKYMIFTLVEWKNGGFSYNIVSALTHSEVLFFIALVSTLFVTILEEIYLSQPDYRQLKKKQACLLCSAILHMIDI